MVAFVFEESGWAGEILSEFLAIATVEVEILSAKKDT